jgi:hypothetical protein
MDSKTQLALREILENGLEYLATVLYGFKGGAELINTGALGQPRQKKTRDLHGSPVQIYTAICPCCDMAPKACDSCPKDL